MSEPHSHPLLELIHHRATIETFDPARRLDEQQVRELVADAIRAPSSFNIQHWRFVAVRDEAGRRSLKEAAYGQEQVEQAGVTFIILGDLEGIEKLPGIMETAVEQGAIPEGKAAAWVRMTGQIYSDPQMARDEAIRSCSLAAMLLMLAAEARGLATCALSGFDPARVKQRFDIAERYLPVLLLAVGHPVGDPPPRMPRLTVDEVLCFDRGKLF